VQRAADHLLERGVVAVSLRELAAAVGVSPRMLVHHFGSRERLVSSAVREARSRRREAFEARPAPQARRPYADVLTDARRWFAADEARPYLQLFGQLYALAQAPDSPHAEFCASRCSTGCRPSSTASPPTAPTQGRRAKLATLTVAVIRGLLQDAIAIGDQERVSAAFERYVALLQPAHQPH
jgi:AcrR family transcriptional regulator